MSLDKAVSQLEGNCWPGSWVSCLDHLLTEGRSQSRSSRHPVKAHSPSLEGTLTLGELTVSPTMLNTSMQHFMQAIEGPLCPHGGSRGPFSLPCINPQLGNLRAPQKEGRGEGGEESPAEWEENPASQIPSRGNRGKGLLQARTPAPPDIIVLMCETMRSLMGPEITRWDPQTRKG